MENVVKEQLNASEESQQKEKVFTPYPGADEKYDDGKDWRIYNPEKYHDPNWSPDKE